MFQKNKMRSILIVWVCLFSVFAFPIVSPAKFLKTISVRNGGASLAPGDEVLLAKFDKVLLNRFVYDDIGGDTWGAIKAINPSTQIYLYQLGRESTNTHDGRSIVFLNDLGRWNISRNHSMGSLNGNNPQLFLLDSNSNRIYNPAFLAWVHDIGSKDYRDYWIEATIHDIASQKWAADGVFVDVATVRRTSMSAMPVKYSTDAAWSTAMNGFINAITVDLNKNNQKLSCNRTGVGIEFVFNEWKVLDNTSNPPDDVFEEGVFAVMWGGGDVQFYPEASWKRQVDLMGEIHNSDVWYQSHSDLDEGQSGTDNYGKPVTFWDILWYAMGSYHIGKNTFDNNSYFGYHISGSVVSWYDEFDGIDLGGTIGTYKVTNYNGNNIYWREFEKGYVFVNPTKYDVSFIALPETCKQLNHSNFKNNPDTLPDINTINIKAHRAAILLKMTFDSIPTLQAPQNLKVINK